MSQITVRNIWAYIQGNLRYKLYYSNTWGWLMRKHIREQIDWRIHIMDRECYKTGSCKLCGCHTTQLQMANKRCDKPCYPTIMSKGTWLAVGEFYKKTQEQNPDLFPLICGKQEQLTSALSNLKKNAK